MEEKEGMYEWMSKCVCMVEQWSVFGRETRINAGCGSEWNPTCGSTDRSLKCCFFLSSSFGGAVC